MEKLKAEVTRLCDMELETAIKKWGLNHSNHESVAVLREEIEEAHEELINAEYKAGEVWERTKHNAAPVAIRDSFTDIYNAAVNLACEAIQAAAMARKGILSNIEIYKEDNDKCNSCESGLRAECVVDGCKYEKKGAGDL